jgi:hypothetical protein
VVLSVRFLFLLLSSIIFDVMFRAGPMIEFRSPTANSSGFVDVFNMKDMNCSQLSSAANSPSPSVLDAYSLHPQLYNCKAFGRIILTIQVQTVFFFLHVFSIKMSLLVLSVV